MRAIILEATLTGATGESSPVSGAIGVIVGGWLDYVGQSGDTADVTLVETLGGVERTVATLSNQNTDRTINPVSAAQGTDGAAISSQYVAGWHIFGGTLHIEVAGAAAGSIKAYLNVIE